MKWLDLQATRIQNTIGKAVTFTGVGLHSGATCKTTICPNVEGSGIRFENAGASVAANAASISNTSRSTTLSLGGISVQTVEHLLSALYGLQIDNAIVRMDGPELPVLDGSSIAFAEAFIEAGIVQQELPVLASRVIKPIVFENGGSWILLAPSSRLNIRYFLEYDLPIIGNQWKTYKQSPANYLTQIAPARTFVLGSEVDTIRKQNLGKGGSLDNTVVIWEHGYSTGLRFADELVRHKILDVLGDLALSGAPLLAEVTAVKSGHALNVRVAQEIQTARGLCAKARAEDKKPFARKVASEVH